LDCKPLKTAFCAAALAVACAFSSVFAQITIAVNNVGYEKTGTKRAIVQSSAAISATTFELLNASGTAVLSSRPLEASAIVGSWSGDGFRNFKAADFSAFNTAGDGYKIKVGSVMSPPFSIGEKILQTKTGADQVAFFNKMRNTDDGDKDLPIFGTGDTHNIYGGWWDATGDPGKHLSHLTYSNYFTPQQIPLVVWALLHANEAQPTAFGASAKAEAAWGADYLLRSLSSEGFFYISVFDNWGDGYRYVVQPDGSRGEREICNWGDLEGITNGNSDGIRSGSYKAAMREGAGVSIAALARAYKANIPGDSGAARYLAGAEKAYAHLKDNPNKYQDDGKENIIDDYTGLLAATELFLATDNEQYRSDARDRAASLISRQSPDGWFYSGKDSSGQNIRPFYHAAEEGFPVVALSRYYQTAASSGEKLGLREAIRKNLLSYHNMTYQSSNPFEYVKMYGAVGSVNPGITNIARSGTATASRSEASFTPNKAIDGDTTNSRWSSYQSGEDNNNQWIAIDLGSLYKVSKVVIYWEAAYGKNYRIEVSTKETPGPANSADWTTVATITNNSSGGPKTHSLTTPANARHVRMYGLEIGNPNGGFSIYEFEVYGEQDQSNIPQSTARFFIPKVNETGYWWQGENARLASMASAFILGAPVADPVGAIAGTMWNDTLFKMATAQLDWILGRNPFNVCMMYGYGPDGGDEYPDYPATRALSNIKGGICNGISSAEGNENNISWMPHKDDGEDFFWKNWRYIEQWLPHNAWYLIAISSLSHRIDNPIDPELIAVKYAAAQKSRFKISTRGKVVRVNLPFGADDRTVIALYNMQGRTVAKHKVQPNSKIATMNLPQNMAKGAYVLSIKDATGKSRTAGKIYLK